jgi:hypothetical protein
LRHDAAGDLDSPQPAQEYSQAAQMVLFRRFVGRRRVEQAQIYRLPADATKLTEALRGGEEFSLAKITALTQDATLTPAHQIPIESVDKWKIVFQRLEELPASQARNASAAPTPSPPTATHSGLPLIPNTRMRRFYDTLRAVGNSAVEEILVKQFVDAGARRRDVLSTYFSESVTHFSRYDITRFPSAEDAFRPVHRSSRMAEYLQKAGAIRQVSGDAAAESLVSVKEVGH